MNTISFRGASFVFATNHCKADAARDSFQRLLGASIEELLIDSDRLGTFSGEVERPGSMLDALRGKVKLARELTKERFVLVSEGSFGAAGGLGFVPQGIEMLLVHDALTDVEVVEQHVSWDTNYATATLSSVEELYRFLPAILFGSHALVLYPHGHEKVERPYKGIVSLPDAESAFTACMRLSPTGSVVAMSDMRAHLNPTRMSAIAACSELLAHRLATPCPQCSSGGFGLVSTVPGLPCEWCGTPTARARAERHSCVVCGKSIEKPRSDGKTTADPGECEVCNP